MQPQENSPMRKIIMIAILAILVFSALYFFVFNKKAPITVLDQFGNPVEAQVVGQDLVDLLNQIQAVTLDESLFRNPAFIHLTDYSIVLPEEPRGRQNPFDTIGGRSTIPSQSAR